MKKQSFESKLERLMEINRELESGTAELEVSIALFKEGVKLTGELTKQLDAAELELTSHLEVVKEES